MTIITIQQLLHKEFEKYTMHENRIHIYSFTFMK